MDIFGDFFIWKRAMNRLGEVAEGIYDEATDGTAKVTDRIVKVVDRI